MESATTMNERKTLTGHQTFNVLKPDRQRMMKHKNDTRHVSAVKWFEVKALV